MYKKENKLLKVGILGCGMICQAAHFEATLKARNVQLYAICDVAEDLLDRMSYIYGSKKKYKKYEQMLEDKEIDAVIIGVADQFHTHCAKQALLAGKHVFVEKPMGITIEECEELERITKITGKIVQVGFMKRFDEGIQFSKTFIEKEIGQVVSIKAWYCDGTSRYTVTDNVQPYIFRSADSKRPKGNPKEDKERYYLLGHSSHLFDTVRFLVGEIISVQAKLVQKEDMYSWIIMAELQNGVVGIMDLTVAIRRDWYEGFEIFGTEGSVIAKTYNPWLFMSTEAEAYSIKRNEYFRPIAADGHFYRRQLEGFADVILNGAIQNGASVEDGISAMRAMKAVYDSAHADGKKVYLKDVEGGL